jgi:polysaccharide biosynthesis transport protein
MDDHLSIPVATAVARRDAGPLPSSAFAGGSLLKLLARRKILILLTILGSVLIAGVSVRMLPPRYTAVMKLAFETRGQSVGDFTAANASTAAQDEASALAGIMNEIEILRSRELAEKVIDKLHLDGVPEFNPALAPSSRFSPHGLSAWLHGHLPDGWLPPEPRLSDAQAAARQRSEIVERFGHRLDIKQVPRSKVFDVRFTSRDANLSAQIVDALGEAYLASRYDDRLANAKRASEWLAANVQQLRDKVVQAERSVETYRRQHDLFQNDKTTLVAAQISDLNIKLLDATAARLAAEAEAAQARRAMGRSSDVETLDQILHSDLIQRFRGELLGIERREAEMNEKYGPRHPLMIQAAAEKQRLKDSLDGEVKRLVRGLESKAEAARIREAAFAKDLNGLKQQNAEVNTASIALRGLERDAEANRLLLEKFMAAFIESSAREDARSVAAYARIISRPAVPQEPSFPRPTMIVALALLAGVLLSLPLAWAVDAMDGGYRSAHQIEQDLGLPVLAHIPAVGRLVRGRHRSALAALVVDHPASIHADAVRSIYNRLSIASSGNLPGTIAITSAEAGEGKSTTAVALARILAKTGRRVLLIDGDLHRSRIAETLHLEVRPGLAELLSDAAGLPQAIQRDPRTSADVIVSGQRRLNASDLLTTPTFTRLLRELQETYEIIVIDTPPLMALTDALFLANAAAATVMVVRWGKTSREVVKYAAMQLATATKRFEGVVLSKVHLKTNARYGYGDSARYGSRLATYYRA